jgi:hypothetical protein
MHVCSETLVALNCAVNSLHMKLIEHYMADHTYIAYWYWFFTTYIWTQSPFSKWVTYFLAWALCAPHPLTRHFYALTLSLPGQRPGDFPQRGQFWNVPKALACTNLICIGSHLKSPCFKWQTRWTGLLYMHWSLSHCSRISRITVYNIYTHYLQWTVHIDSLQA